jgi:hypothetical protein
VGQSGLTRRAGRSSFDCEYLVGDDTCSALKESGIGVLRAEACENEVKDACCYTCSLRRSCKIGCDLPVGRRIGKESKTMQVHEADAALDVDVRIECGGCVHYLKRKCPRHYDGDTELWRRQDPCEIFQPAQNVNSQR